MNKVFIDHQIFSLQTFGGISRYFSELIRNSNMNLQVELPAVYSRSRHLKELTQLKHLQEWPNAESNIGKKLLAKLNFMHRLDPFQENNLKLSEAINANPLAVVHATYYNPYFLSLLKKETKLVVTIYDLIHENFPEFSSPDDKTCTHRKEILTRADHVICISQETKNDLMSHYQIKDDKISVIHLSDSFKSIVTIDEDFESRLPSKYFLFTGNRSAYKNWFFLLRAFQKVRKAHTDVFLVCTGSPFSPGEKAYLEDLGVHSAVRHFSPNEIQLYSLYKNAVAFIFPSYAEGFGIPVLEAMRAGTPALLSDIPVFKEIAGDSAAYFPPKDIRSLNSMMVRVLEDKVFAEKLRKMGFSQVKNYSWEKTAAETFNIYKRLSAQ